MALNSSFAKDRRTFLQGAAALGVLAAGGTSVLAAPGGTIARSPNGRPLAGVFPIGWTPCKPDNSLDLDAMVRQQQFLNRGKVAGMAWPQNASGWQSLSSQEWHAGAEALASVKGNTALVLGVQTTGFNTTDSQAYARKAKSLSADAIISLVPPSAGDADVIAYFKALSDASGLPIMVQAVGNVSVDQLVTLAKAIPAIVAVKDEAGDPLERAPDLLQKTGGKLEDFSGGGGMTFFAEMELGFLGTCPYTGLADVLQVCFNAYQAGRKQEAYDTFGRFLAFNSLPHANEYVMKARGVFAEDAVMRSNPGASPGGGRRHGAITEAHKAQIRSALNTYLKPFLVA
ncbi:MAG TPA: dihydrodipicolinate synthase family protein [Rhizomicrobium sp.]|jgi:4-hydroxy-tetrahydrodipicolinate synthase|nr:dihydrodipicolinate synthase family protein [Rhizomicrobium sp.]